MKRTDKKDKYHIMAHDPSIRGWGWSVFDMKGNLVECGAIKTESQAKKKRIREGDDRARRVNEIALSLLKVIERYNIILLLGELPHGSQSAKAAVMIGITTGILQTLGCCKNLAVEWYSENDAKKAVTDEKSISKEEMKQLMAHHYNWNPTGINWRDEAMADSMAIHFVAMQNSPQLKMYSKIKHD